MNKPTLPDSLPATAVSSIESEQVRLLNDAAPVSIAGSLIIAAVTAWVLWSVTPQAIVVAWGSLLATVQFIRLLLFFAIRRTPNPLPTRQLWSAVRISVLLSGLAWGALPIWLYPADFSHQVFLPFVAAGVTGAALAALAADRIAVMLFVIPTLLPLIARLFMTGTEITTAMGGLITLYLAFLGIAAGRNERDFHASYALREEIDRQNSALNLAQKIAWLGSFDWNPVSGELRWSTEHFRLWGLTPNSVTPDYALFRQGVHPDDITRLEAILQQAMQGSRVYDCVHRVIWPDGSEHQMHGRGEVIFDDSGKPVQMIGTVQDITAQLRTETALQNSEKRYEIALAASRDGLWDWDVATGKVYYSPRWEEMFGYQTGEAVQSLDAFAPLVHPDDVAGMFAEVQRYLQREIPHYAREFRMNHRDGTPMWTLHKAVGIFAASGKCVRLIGTTADITERKNAEQALRESQSQLQTAQEIARLGYFRSDLRSGALEWSDRLVRMLGYEPGEIIPSMEIFTASIHPDYRDRVLGTLAQAFSATYTVTAGERATLPTLEYRALRRDGTEIWLRSEAQAEVDESGKPILIQGTAQDITELKRTELAMMAARDEAEQASRAKSEFLSSMSHELRTPMNAILGFSQLMRYDATLSSANLENIDEIINAGKHLLQLINEVLDLAKVESGQIALSLEPVEVEPVVEECLALMSTLAEKRAIRIHYTAIAAAVVRADEMRLKQALLNLLSNAVKYNRHGGRVTLDVARTNSDTVRIQVTDTGPGIAAHQLTELFQPFNRLNAERSEIEGTGIGLSITQRIIDLMGGRLGVSSEVGAGSTFWIELPVDNKTEINNSQADAHPVVPGVALPASETQHLVLYIEDNPANLKLVAQILGKRQHIHLITAHTPELGIELARTRLPELILLDINLPGMDGFQVLEIFKREAALQHIPVIAVTANAMPSDLERGKAAGFADYLTKPLNIVQFHAVIDRYLTIPASDALLPE